MEKDQAKVGQKVIITDSILGDLIGEKGTIIKIFGQDDRAEIKFDNQNKVKLYMHRGITSRGTRTYYFSKIRPMHCIHRKQTNV